MRAFYAEAETLLAHPVIRFDATQIAAIGNAIGEAIQRAPYTCYACAIMPDHVHLVIRKHRHRAEEMIELLQDATRLRLSARAWFRPTIPCGRSAVGRRFSIRRRRCVRALRMSRGILSQRGCRHGEWPFVKIYDGWAFGRRG